MTNCISDKINNNNIIENITKYIQSVKSINAIVLAVVIKIIDVIIKTKNIPKAINKQIAWIFCIVIAVFLDIEYPINENTKQTTAAIINATSINGAPNKKMINENPNVWHSMKNIHTVNVNPSEWLNGFIDQIHERIEETMINEIADINTVKKRRSAKFSGLTAFKNEWIQISPKTNAKIPMIENPIPAFKKIW